jgi:hypothetical protein
MFPLTKNGIWKNNLQLEDFMFDDQNNTKAEVLKALNNKIEHIKNN